MGLKSVMLTQDVRPDWMSSIWKCGSLFHRGQNLRDQTERSSKGCCSTADHHAQHVPLEWASCCTWYTWGMLRASPSPLMSSSQQSRPPSGTWGTSAFWRISEKVSQFKLTLNPQWQITHSLNSLHGSQVCVTVNTVWPWCLACSAYLHSCSAYCLAA